MLNIMTLQASHFKVFLRIFPALRFEDFVMGYGPRLYPVFFTFLAYTTIALIDCFI